MSNTKTLAVILRITRGSTESMLVGEIAKQVRKNKRYYNLIDTTLWEG